MKIDEVTQPGWKDAVDCIREREMWYGTSEWRVPAIVKLHLDDDAAASVLSTCGELMECLDIVPGISEMPQRTSRPPCGHMRLGSGKPQFNTKLLSLVPDPEPDSLLILNLKSVELVCFHSCI